MPVNFLYLTYRKLFRGRFQIFCFPCHITGYFGQYYELHVTKTTQTASEEKWTWGAGRCRCLHKLKNSVLILLSDTAESRGQTRMPRSILPQFAQLSSVLALSFGGFFPCSCSQQLQAYIALNFSFPVVIGTFLEWSAMYLTCVICPSLNWSGHRDQLCMNYTS